MIHCPVFFQKERGHEVILYFCCNTLETLMVYWRQVAWWQVFSFVLDCVRLMPELFHTREKVNQTQITFLHDVLHVDVQGQRSGCAQCAILTLVKFSAGPDLIYLCEESSINPSCLDSLLPLRESFLLTTVLKYTTEIKASSCSN